MWKEERDHLAVRYAMFLYAHLACFSKQQSSLGLGEKGTILSEINAPGGLAIVSSIRSSPQRTCVFFSTTFQRHILHDPDELASNLSMTFIETLL